MDRPQHEFGCTWFVGRPCICDALRKEREARLAFTPHSQHVTPVPGCLRCDDGRAEAQEVAQDIREARQESFE